MTGINSFHQPNAGTNKFNIDLTSHALNEALEIIDAICCVSGSLNYIDNVRAQTGGRQLARAVNENDTPAIFNWMMDSFSYQGISNEVADNYIERHGNVTWQKIEQLLSPGPTCPLLRNYWSYDNCRYDKLSGCCSEPEHTGCCPVPTHRLRNGRLNQTGYSLFFFVRDLAGRDFPAWIDARLAEVSLDAPDRAQLLQEAIVGPMRDIYGVSDKVITMTMSSVLLAAPDSRQNWAEAGSQMIVIDTLVHNLLHRTGILDKAGRQHAYGPACYLPGRCADLVRLFSARIDARRFNRRYPANFPRFIQHALWHYCALDGDNICNGNKIDDLKSCENIYCIISAKCSKIALKMPKNRDISSI